MQPRRQVSAVVQSVPTRRNEEGVSDCNQIHVALLIVVCSVSLSPLPLSQSPSKQSVQLSPDVQTSPCGVLVK